MLAAGLLGGGQAGEPGKPWRERRWGEGRPRGLWFERLERSDPWWPRGALQPQPAQPLHWETASGRTPVLFLTSTPGRGSSQGLWEGSQGGGPP